MEVNIRKASAWVIANTTSGGNKVQIAFLLQQDYNPLHEQYGDDATNESKCYHVIILEVSSPLDQLSSQKKKKQQEACWLISYITPGTRDQIKAVMAHTIIPSIVKLLSHALVNIRKTSTRVVSNVICGGITIQR